MLTYFCRNPVLEFVILLNIIHLWPGVSSRCMSCLACLACQGLCSGAACLVSCCGRTAPLHHGVRLLYFVFFLATSVAAWALAAFGQEVAFLPFSFSPLALFFPSRSCRSRDVRR